MTEGHCLLTPKEHFPNLPSCDETVAREMLNIRRLFGFIRNDIFYEPKYPLMSKIKILINYAA